MKYIFNEAEFVTLLAICGVKSLCSFEVNNNPEDGDIVSSVHSLYKSGFAEEYDGRMLPANELKEIIRLMANAKYTVKITVPNPSVPARLVYCVGHGEVIVLHRHLSSAENALKIERVHAEDFAYDIIDNEINEYVSYDPDEDEELAERMRALGLYDEKDSSRTVFTLEVINAVTGKTEETVNVNNTTVYTRIVSEGSVGVSDELYTDEKMTGYLLNAFWRR